MEKSLDRCARWVVLAPERVLDARRDLIGRVQPRPQAWRGVNGSLTADVLNGYREAHPIPHEDTMLDPESDIAEQLANAIRHHQKNLVEQDKAEKNVETLRQRVTQLEEISDGNKDDEG